MTTTTILVILGLAFACLGFVGLLIMAICKKTANATAATPAATNEGDDKSAANTNENGEGTTSDEAVDETAKVTENAEAAEVSEVSEADESVETVDEKAETVEPEVNEALEAAKAADEKAEAADKKAGEALEAAKAADEKAEAADKKAGEAAEAAKAANEKAEEALEANQATDKKVEEEKAREAEEKRQAFMSEHADEIDLYVLRFSQAYSDYASAILRGNVRKHDAKALGATANEANQECIKLESAQICRDTEYGYAGELKRNGYKDIGSRQRNQEEVPPEELENLDAEEQNAFCSVDEANANLDAARAAAETADKAVESNKAEETVFAEVAESAVAAMKAAYSGLVACKLNDEEIAGRVNLSVDMLKVIVA